MTPTVTGPRSTEALSSAPAEDAAAVGGKAFEQAVLDDDRQAESDEQRRQDILAERPVEQEILQRPADARTSAAPRSSAATKGSRPSVVTSDEDQEGGEHDQVAMGEVDQPHDAEDEAEARREQRIEPAEQDALHDGVEPVHASIRPEIGRVDGVAGRARDGRPESVTRPSIMQ